MQSDFDSFSNVRAMWIFFFCSLYSLLEMRGNFYRNFLWGEWKVNGMEVIQSRRVEEWIRGYGRRIEEGGCFWKVQ